MRFGKQEVVVITGASAGLGRATAQAFARRGAKIGLISRDAGRLESAQNEIRQLGGEALIYVMDVADPMQMENAADLFEKELGPIDIWVNNAMASVLSPFKYMTPEEFKRVTEVTYLGVVYGTMAALRRMVPRDKGAIIQVGSTQAAQSMPLHSAYCGAKHAIKGFTDSVRRELLYDKSHVHLTMVQLPSLNTPWLRWVKSRLPEKAQPIPPIYQPEVGADAIIWAAHHKQREINVGYMTLGTIWGSNFLGGCLDKYLARKVEETQQMNEPEDPNRPDNLWQTLPGEVGAHGIHDAQSLTKSPELWIAKNRKWIGLGALAGVLAIWSGRCCGKKTK